MASKNDGGPAFPFWPDMMRVDENGRAEPVGGKGMTLRDWIAGQALPSVIGLIGIPEDGPDDLWDASIAERSYAIADRMIAERAK